MKTVTQHIRKHLENQVALFHQWKTAPDLQTFRDQEWVPQFERLMRQFQPYTLWDEHFIDLMKNRLTMGCLRYGPLEDKREHNPFPMRQYIQQRYDRYAETGNQEHLVDCANMLLIEFEFPTRPMQFLYAFNGGPDPQSQINTYWNCGNKYCLIIAACGLMEEFVQPVHPTPHFEALDDN